MQIMHTNARQCTPMYTHPVLQAPLPATEDRTFSPLRKVGGVLRSGCMTLLMGPPGAGKTVLMQTLAGRFPIKKPWKVRCDLR